MSVDFSNTLEFENLMDVYYIQNGLPLAHMEVNASFFRENTVCVKAVDVFGFESVAIKEVS